MKDFSHGALDLLGFNGIDDKLADIRNKPTVTTGDKVGLALSVFDAAITVSTLFEGGKGKVSEGKTYQTYTKASKTGGEPYSGRTSGTKTPEENIASRDRNHHMNNDFGPAKLDKSSPNKAAIRGREQQLIEKNGGAKSQKGTSGNERNGVSPQNPKKDYYKKEADKEFGTN